MLTTTALLCTMRGRLRRGVGIECTATQFCQLWIVPFLLFLHVHTRDPNAGSSVCPLPAVFALNVFSCSLHVCTPHSLCVLWQCQRVVVWVNVDKVLRTSQNTRHTFNLSRLSLSDPLGPYRPTEVVSVTCSARRSLLRCALVFPHGTLASRAVHCCAASWLWSGRDVGQLCRVALFASSHCHILKPSRLTASGALGGGARWKAMAAAAAVADAPGKTLP